MFRCTGRFLKTWVVSQKTVWKRTSFDSYFWSTFTSAESDVSRASCALYRDCLRKNSKCYVSTKSGFAKTKYKLQNMWDGLVHGKKEKASAQVAFMITQDMKQSLADLGYSKQEIGNLKPAYAQLILTKNISYSTWKATKDILIEEYEKEEAQRRKEAAEEANRIAAEELANQQKNDATTNSSEAEPSNSSLTVVDEKTEESTSPAPSLMIVEEEKTEEKL